MVESVHGVFRMSRSKQLSVTRSLKRCRLYCGGQYGKDISSLLTNDFQILHLDICGIHNCLNYICRLGIISLSQIPRKGLLAAGASETIAFYPLTLISSRSEGKFKNTVEE